LRLAVGLPAKTGRDWPLDATTPIRASHPRDLRTWFAEYERAAGYGTRARCVTHYDNQFWASAGANLVGRRAWACDPSGRAAWTYDPYGRMSLSARRTDGLEYLSTFSHDALDRIRTLTFPDGVEAVGVAWVGQIKIEPPPAGCSADLASCYQHIRCL
jgi:hypothetical protein